jgi:hypothetical protein
MQPLVVASDSNRGVKEFAEPQSREQLLARSVGNNSSVAHQNHSLDLGQNVS